MLVSNLTSDSDYFIVDKSFASLAYTGSSVVYTFTLYGKLLQALIDGNDEIKLQMVRKTRPRIKYFVGTSMEEVEESNIGFVQNAKKQLEDTIEKSLIKEEILELINILPDETVSAVGNGTVNENNYLEFLPNIEQINVLNRTARRTSPKTTDVSSFAALTRKLFFDTGIYPGRIADVNFPGKILSRDSDGLSFGMNTAATKMLFNNALFKDYYQRYYVKNTNSRISQRLIKAKAEYQRFKVNVEFPFDTGINENLPSYKDLSIRVVLLKKDIEMSSKLFSFENSILYEEATAGAKKIETSIIVPNPKDVRPDLITITNNEDYPVEVTTFEYTSLQRSIAKTKLGTVTLAKNEKTELHGTQIYFDQSESRAYAVTANRFIPGIQGVANVVSIVSPPMTSSPPKANSLFSMDIVPQGTSTLAKIQVTGLENSSQSALVYKRKIGENERHLLGRVRYGVTSITDTKIQEGDIFIYTAEMQVNGASSFAKATTGFVSMKNGDVSRLSFSIVESKIVGPSSRPSHRFKILENVTTTPASSLLSSANETGQASVYQDEIEDEKQDTTIIARYIIFRVRKVSGSVEYLGSYEAGRQLQFPVINASSDLSNETYEYLVIPQSTALAALSYKTVVEEVDPASGNSYKIRYKKWRDKNYNRSEILPSTTTVLNNDLANIFFNMPTGVAETVTFTKRVTTGRTTSLRAVSKENSDCAFLSWRYTGDINTVLHFVVFANYNGTKAPIGLAIPDDVKNRKTPITYCDNKLGSVSGEVIYSVIPVFSSGEEGRESTGVKVSSTKNYPRRALR